jgi:hypothetical protein
VLVSVRGYGLHLFVCFGLGMGACAERVPDHDHADGAGGPCEAAQGGHPRRDTVRAMKTDMQADASVAVGVRRRRSVMQPL